MVRRRKNPYFSTSWQFFIVIFQIYTNKNGALQHFFVAMHKKPAIYPSSRQTRNLSHSIFSFNNPTNRIKKMANPKVEMNETFEKTQEFATKQIASTEKAVESMIEFNAAMFKSGEVVAKKFYDNYLSNVAAAFDGVKALNKTSDAAEFYKVATANSGAAAERMMEQTKGVVELSGKVMKETAEAGRIAYSKSFPANS